MSHGVPVGKGEKLEDSNMANYGSKEHKAARKGAAATEKEFAGAGQKPGVLIWRVENRRTASDTPDFGIKAWPKADYGSFYTGDSYLILNTYKVKDEKGKETDKLAWDVHFWIGKESSQDEYGVAAYKAVELDDLLDDGPVQHRETQGFESALFQSYFPHMQYMEGGIASGFRHVKPEEYKPRLFQIRRTKKTVRAFEVPAKAKSVNNGDVFILDAGPQIYTFIGESANAFEKMKGGALAHNLVSAREGKSKSIAGFDDAAWKILGGSPKDIQPAIESEESEFDKPLDSEKLYLYRLSDSTGKMTFKEEANGKLNIGMFDSNDVFIVDANIELFVWIGKGSSKEEKSNAMKFATEYLTQKNKPITTPITRINEGQVHHVFGSLIKW